MYACVATTETSLSSVQSCLSSSPCVKTKKEEEEESPFQFSPIYSALFCLVRLAFRDANRFYFVDIFVLSTFARQSERRHDANLKKLDLDLE